MSERTETGPVDFLRDPSCGMLTVTTLLLETESGEHEDVLVDVQDVSSRGIVVFVPEPVEVGRTARLCSASASDQVLIHHCEKRANGFLAVLRLVCPERRTEERFPTAAKGMLYFVTPTGRRVVDVSLTNISQGGVQLEMQEPVEVPQLVQLSGDGFECTGVVCYCHRDGERFLAGVQFSRRPNLKQPSAHFA
jgi:PilZ domain